MSEEMNRRESALSDAELESVSGAGSDDEFYAIMRRAESICDRCNFSSGKHCTASYQPSLEAYLKEHGIDSVRDFHNCLYYKP